MKNTSELRQGNCIFQSHLKALNVVIGIKPGYILTDCKVADGDWAGDALYEPIPLTEEWLIKLGFIMNKNFTFPLYQIGINKSILNQVVLTIAIRNNETMAILREGYPGDGIHEDTGMTLWESRFDGDLHVHQLQNIFQSISKVELTIKEPAV